jgi:hypothetical protein
MATFRGFASPRLGRRRQVGRATAIKRYHPERSEGSALVFVIRERGSQT